MTEVFQLDDIAIEAEYRRVKTMCITVYPPDGRVFIAVPLNTAPGVVREFAAAKLPWIKKHREIFRAHAQISGPLKNNAPVYIWGKAHTLKIIERKGNAKIIVDDEQMTMYVKPNSTKEKKQQILDKWYRLVINKTAPQIISKWEPVIGVKVQGLYLRKMKTHWGSCNYERQTIRLNSELVKQKSECLEYVIVHEMVHIIEPTHNRNFYRLMNKFLPDWKVIRKKMNTGEL
jgi:predicted metal-dependent hydrolase